MERTNSENAYILLWEVGSTYFGCKVDYDLCWGVGGTPKDNSTYKVAPISTKKP